MIATPQTTSVGHHIDFVAINTAALSSLSSLLYRWLPDGRIEGREYVARNPTRTDKTPGSFKININTGKWCDFATGDAGGDVIVDRHAKMTP